MTGGQIAARPFVHAVWTLASECVPGGAGYGKNKGPSRIHTYTFP